MMLSCLAFSASWRVLTWERERVPWRLSRLAFSSHWCVLAWGREKALGRSWGSSPWRVSRTRKRGQTVWTWMPDFTLPKRDWPEWHGTDT